MWLEWCLCSLWYVDVRWECCVVLACTGKHKYVRSSAWSYTCIQRTTTCALECSIGYCTPIDASSQCVTQSRTHARCQASGFRKLWDLIADCSEIVERLKFDREDDRRLEAKVTWLNCERRQFSEKFAAEKQSTGGDSFVPKWKNRARVVIIFVAKWKDRARVVIILFPSEKTEHGWW